MARQRCHRELRLQHVRTLDFSSRYYDKKQICAMASQNFVPLAFFLGCLYQNAFCHLFKVSLNVCSNYANWKTEFSPFIRNPIGLRRCDTKPHLDLRTINVSRTSWRFVVGTYGIVGRDGTPVTNARVLRLSKRCWLLIPARCDSDFDGAGPSKSHLPPIQVSRFGPAVS